MYRLIYFRKEKKKDTIIPIHPLVMSTAATGHTLRRYTPPAPTIDDDCVVGLCHTYNDPSTHTELVEKKWTLVVQLANDSLPYPRCHWLLTELLMKVGDWTRLSSDGQYHLVACILDTMDEHGENPLLFKNSCALVNRIIDVHGVRLWDIILTVVRLVLFHFSIGQLDVLIDALTLLKNLSSIPKDSGSFQLFRHQFQRYKGDDLMRDIILCSKTSVDQKQLAQHIQELMH